MKILVISYEFPPLGGGGAKVVLGLSEELAKAGHEIDIVTMGFRGLPSFEERGNIRIHRVKCIRTNQSVCYFPEMIPYLITAFMKAWSLTKKSHYDINHTHFIFPDGVVSFLLKIFRRLPFVVTAHGSDVPGYNPDRFKLLHLLLLPIWKLISGSANRIICPSQHIEQLILKSNAHAKTTVIPNGINIHKFSPDREKERQILGVTRMFERKGMQYLVQAATGLDTDFKTRIVGDGPYLEPLRKLAAEIKSPVEILGFLDNKGPELKELYETSRIFVFTSESENFPIVLLEAMVAGMAIITSSGTGCAEVVGDTGVLVPPKNIQRLREELLNLMQNPLLCAQLGKSARKRVEDHFSWESVIARHLQTYKNASGKNR